MLRKSLLLVVVATFAVLAPPVDAQSSKSKAKARKNEAKTLKAGDEASVFVLGTEAIGNPNLAKAGVVGPDYLVLAVFRFAAPGDDTYQTDVDFQTHNRLVEATKIGDKAGVEQMIVEGRAAKLMAGTKLVVTYRHAGEFDCRARVTGGEHVGKVIEIAVRNLR